MALGKLGSRGTGLHLDVDLDPEILRKTAETEGRHVQTAQRSVQGDPDRDLKHTKMQTFRTFGKGV